MWWGLMLWPFAMSLELLLLSKWFAHRFFFEITTALYSWQFSM